MAKKMKLQIKPEKANGKILEKVLAEYVFWSHDGSVFTDLREMAEGLMTMADETFSYHSNSEKRDFGNWIRDVIGDAALANDVALAAGKAQAADYIYARIDETT